MPYLHQLRLSISSPQASVFCTLRRILPCSVIQTRNCHLQALPLFSPTKPGQSSPDPTWAMAPPRPRQAGYYSSRILVSPSPRAGTSTGMPTATVLSGPSTSTSESHPDFASTFNAALEAYKRKTKIDLASHPLLPKLQSCDSPEAILNVIREQIPASSQSQNGDDQLIKWFTPTVYVLSSFSTALGGDVGLVNVKTFSS